MMTPDQKKKILRVLEKQPTAVVSTCDLDGHPAAAVVLFATTDELDIIFGTHPTRKYHNLKATGNAAMAFLQEEWPVTRDHPKDNGDVRKTQMTRLTTANDIWSIQCHGKVHELSGTNNQKYINTFMAKHPDASAQLLAGTVFFKMDLLWIRYIHVGSASEEFEIKLSPLDWH